MADRITAGGNFLRPFLFLKTQAGTGRRAWERPITTGFQHRHDGAMITSSPNQPIEVKTMQSASFCRHRQPGFNPAFQNKFKKSSFLMSRFSASYVTFMKQ